MVHRLDICVYRRSSHIHIDHMGEKKIPIELCGIWLLRRHVLDYGATFQVHSKFPLQSVWAFLSFVQRKWKLGQTGSSDSCLFFRLLTLSPEFSPESCRWEKPKINLPSSQEGRVCGRGKHLHYTSSLSSVFHQILLAPYVGLMCWQWDNYKQGEDTSTINRLF